MLPYVIRRALDHLSHATGIMAANSPTLAQATRAPSSTVVAEIPTQPSSLTWPLIHVDLSGNPLGYPAIRTLLHVLSTSPCANRSDVLRRIDVQ